MAVFTAKVGVLTGELIEALTGFQSSEENYDACYQYCKSNFKYHRYLDVNSSYVERAIKNVETKFQIHSLDERAHHLSLCMEKFISLSSYPNSDTHYKVLHFLLETSCSPTNASYDLPDHVEPLVVKRQMDGFNWAAYLNEGIEIPSFSDSTSEEMSELSDDDSSCPDSADDTEQPLSDIGNLENTKPQTGITTDHYSSSVGWLSDNVTSVYWQQYSVHNKCSYRNVGHPCCNLLTDSGGKPDIIVTEPQVVRETLWMLMGVVGGCVYDKETLQVLDNVGMMHTSMLAHRRSLNVFSKLGCQLRSIRHKVESAAHSNTTTQVFEGAIYFINDYINKLNSRLRSIEKDVSQNKRFVSLLSLKIELNLYQKEVACVYSVVESCTDKCSILDVLWKHLDYYDSMDDRNSIAVVFPWLLAALQSLMDILDNWLTDGTLTDPYSEFFVQKQSSSECNGWNDGFILQDCQPLCVRPFVDKIFVAGKSWCYIESLGRKDLSQSTPSMSLFEEFKSRLFKTDKWHGGNTPPVKDEGVCGQPPNLVMSGIDPVLCDYLTKVSTSNSVEKYSHQKNEIAKSQYKLDYCTPVTEVITDSIYHCVDTKYTQATTSLTNILKTDYKLLDHFNTVRQFILMEAGDAMHTFSCLLFNRMVSGATWLDSSFLNSILEESLQEHYSHVGDMLSIDVDQSAIPVLSLRALEGFSFQYKVDWPIDVFFPQVLINTYNQIFTFLLQVKFSKWCLIEINVGKYRQQYTTKLHRLFLLKAKLLHFVNSLNQYLLTRILHSFGIQFQDNVSNAGDVDTILRLHTDYVDHIHDRCLLNKKAHLVKEAISRTLQLTITLYSMWSRGVDSFSWHDGERIELEFTRCINFLMSCLNKHVKRGSFPHLETLSYSLSSLLSGPRYFD